MLLFTLRLLACNDDGNRQMLSPASTTLNRKRHNPPKSRVENLDFCALLLVAPSSLASQLLVCHCRSIPVPGTIPVHYHLPSPFIVHRTGIDINEAKAIPRD